MNESEAIEGARAASESRRAKAADRTLMQGTPRGDIAKIWRGGRGVLLQAVDLLYSITRDLSDFSV